MELATLTSIPGVLQAVIADDSGRLIECAGGTESPATAILVLAHATLSAASELGRRSGGGECSELIQHHDNGCIYLRSLPQRRVLLVRCQTADTVPALRVAIQQLATPSMPSVSQTGVIDLSAALHAEPAW